MHYDVPVNDSLIDPYSVINNFHTQLYFNAHFGEAIEN